MIRFLHTSDWQLGMTRRFLGPEAQARFGDARIEALRTLGRLARQEGCAFVVVAGDVYESNQVERQVLVRSLEAMAATPEVTFYLLPGNHDPLDASSVFRSRTFVEHVPSNVVVLDSTAPRSVGEGVELIAAPWTSKRPLVDLIAAAIPADLPPSGSSVRIVVGHGAADLLAPESSDPAVIDIRSLEARIEAGVIHYVALGDRHSTTDVGSSGRIWYSGAPEPTDFVETDPANALVVEIDGPDVTVTPHRVGTWRFLRSDHDLTAATDLESLSRHLDAIDEKHRTVLRLSLVGQLGLADHARLQDLLSHYQDLFAAVEVWEATSDLVVLPADADFSHLPLAGFARAALDDLRSELAQPASAEVARDALGLLYRLTGAAS